MTVKDLQVLEIGLELFRMEKPLQGECDPLLELLIRVVQLEKGDTDAGPGRSVAGQCVDGRF